MGLLMKCANCNSDALYEYKITLNKSNYYCGKDLPKFLEQRKKAGLLQKTEQFKVEYDAAIDTLTPTIPTELNLEETSIEKPTPKKKAPSKKAK
jgi:hypothetical protein